jgi:hypothetical protein
LRMSLSRNAWGLLFIVSLTMVRRRRRRIVGRKRNIDVLLRGNGKSR